MAYMERQGLEQGRLPQEAFAVELTYRHSLDGGKPRRKRTYWVFQTRSSAQSQVNRLLSLPASSDDGAIETEEVRVYQGRFVWEEVPTLEVERPVNERGPNGSLSEASAPTSADIPRPERRRRAA